MTRGWLPPLVLSALVLLDGGAGASAGRSSLEKEAEPPAPPATFSILFTGETRGNLVPCSCPDGPWGGLARRVGYLSGRRGKIQGPLLTLHGGGFLPVGTVPLRNDPEAEVEFVSLLTESLSRSGFDAIVLGAEEREYLTRIVPERWPDLELRALDSSPAPQPRVFSMGGVPVAVLAVDESLADATLAAVARSARSLADLVIVLARADGVSGRRIAEQTAADLVILSYGVRTAAPVRYAKSWVVGAGREGKEIGELQLERTPEGLQILDYRLVPMDETVAADPATENQVRRLLDDFGPGWRTLISPVE